MNQSEETKLIHVSVEDAVCQFALRRAIDDVLDDVIVAGADKVTLLEHNRNRKSNKLAMSRSQIKNVVNEATSKRSRQAVTNFIRYQMGRQGGDAWRHEHRTGNRKAFGREVIADIESEEGEASTIDVATRKVCEAVKQKLQRRNMTTDEAELKRETRAQLTALYLGYLNRTYAYCEEMDDPKKLDDQVCWNDVKRITKRKEETP
jgi:hypothetical protein